jgi:CxxC motif-containing protein
MATDITLQDYLDNDPRIKEAKKILNESTKALSGSRNVAPDVAAELQAIRSRAEQVYNKLISDTTIYFKKNYVGISTSGIADSIARLEASKLVAPSVEVKDSLQVSIDALKENLKNPKPYVEPTVKVEKSKDSTKSTSTQEVKASKEQTDLFNQLQTEYNTRVVNAGQYITNDLNDTGRTDLAKELNKVYGLSLRTDGKYDPNLKSAYLKALADNVVRSQDSGRSIPFTEFLVISGNEGTYKSGADAGPSMSGSISDPTRAAGLINSAFRTQLQRDPTAAEVAKYTKILNNAEKKNPFKTVKGITTGGLDKEQFLIGEIVKLPEFAKKKTDKVALTGQSILGTAKANGVTLNQSQIDSFAKRVQDGTDIKIIDKEIRGIAALGMPDKVVKLLDQGVDLDTVYSPYRNLMASILELNPESIDLKDPTLRSAFGPDKEIPIYDFEKNLRKDYRWQYTDNAKRDVSNVALKVLRDFGFQA